MGKRISAQQFTNAVHVMVNGYCGCYTFKYDERLAVCIGWELADEDEQEYRLASALKVWTSDPTCGRL